MITFFKNKNNNSKKKYKKYKTITTILKSFHTVVVMATRTRSITLSLNRIGFIVTSKSTGVAWGLSTAKHAKNKIIINKYNQYKKHYEEDQQTIRSFHKLYRKSLQDSLIDKNEYESLCSVFTKYVD